MEQLLGMGGNKMLFINLKTERLLLKNISTTDRDFIFSQFSDDVVNRHLFDAEPLIDIQGADEIIKFYVQPEPRLQHRWIIARESDGEKMGTCGFHCWNLKDSTVDVGYDLKEQFWGNGYMQEAMREIISFAKDKMYVKEIRACIYVDNQKSIRLVENLGFVMSGTYYESFRGNEYLHNIYSLYLPQ
jgi:ribosomal-protein-alanine N-acetyltransferase